MEIWQEGFYDWTVRDKKDWMAKVEYIRMNPVRARLSEKPEDWPYSSASGRFALDPMPIKYLEIPSGAKALAVSAQTPGLKPRPPKEEAALGLKPPNFESLDVGAKTPTPSGARAQVTPSATPGLKPRPPKEDRLMDLPQTGVKSART